MAYLKIKNRAVSSLASDVTDVATSWVLASGEGAKFPTTGDFHLTCEDEIVKCTARTTDTLTVVRAQEGTTGVAHTAGKAVELRITAGVVESRTTWTLNKLLKGAGAGADPTEIDVPSGAADFPMKLKPAVTRYVIPGWQIASYSSVTLIGGTIYYIPIFVEETTTYIRICVYVGTAVAGTTDLRIFNWSNGVPGSLVLSAGTVDTSTTGAKEITISQELTRGYYLLALRPSVNTVFRCPDTAFSISTPLGGYYEGSSPWMLRVVLAVSAAYADPAPAPTSGNDARYAIAYLREN